MGITLTGELLNVYVCANGHEFHTHDGTEPECCPYCTTVEWEYSHDVKTI